MKYTIEAEIHARLERIAQVLMHPEKRAKWYKEISGYQLISGRPGKVGSKARIWMKVLGEWEITETILAIDYPNHFTVLYEMPNGKLKLDGRLEPQDPTHTLYIVEHQFTFSNILNPVGFLMKSSLIKQSERVMEKFKKYAEGET